MNEEQDTEEDILRRKREKRELKGKVFGVKLKQPEPEQCLVEEQKELFEKMIKDKQISLEEELEKEKQHYEKYGLFSNRDTEEIEKELEIAKKVLNNIDNIPKCKS